MDSNRTEPREPSRESAPLRFGEKFTIWWRSHFVQATQNETGMLNMGALFCLIPGARRRLESDQHQAFKRRHLGVFNSNPFISTLGIGALSRLELDRQQGDVSDETMVRFRHAMSGPLGACGDELFWVSIRPAASSLAVVAGVMIGPWAAVATFLVIFTACQEWYRWHGLTEGLNGGLKLGKCLEGKGYKGSLKKAHSFLGLSVGMAAGFLSVRALHNGSIAESIVWIGAVVFGAVGFRMVSSVTTIMTVGYALVLVALLAIYSLG